MLVACDVRTVSLISTARSRPSRRSTTSASGRPRVDCEDDCEDDREDDCAVDSLVDGRERAEVVEDGHAAACRDLRGGRLRDLAEPVKIRAAEHPIACDVGEHEPGDAYLTEAFYGFEEVTG